MRGQSVPGTAAGSTAAGHNLRTFYDALFATYGPQRWWPGDTALEVVVGAYLTQNTSWQAVEKSIANLKGRGVLHLQGLRTLPEEELRLLIRPSGFMTRKAAAVRAFIAWLDREHGGSIEALAKKPAAGVRRQLLHLPGVGEETADAILLYALGQPAMVADEYLRRIAARHGLAPEGAKYSELQKLAEESFRETPRKSRAAFANEFHALVVAVGKQHCGRLPKCEGCPLQGFL